MEPMFFPPAFLQDVAALTPMRELPPQGRVIEGTTGWILSTHFGPAPYVVDKKKFTAESFGDCQLRLEFMTPKDDLYGWGNSGVIFMGRNGEALVAAIRAKDVRVAEQTRFNALKRFVKMLVRQKFLEAVTPLEKALDGCPSPKPKAANLRDI